MKAKIIFFILLTQIIFTSRTYAQCTTGSLFPAETYTPLCTDANETIATNCQPGQYTNINITTNKHYTFSGSGLEDYITITNASGNIVYATGKTPLNWASGTVSGVIRFYLHKNYSCATDNTARTKYIKCTTVGTCAWPTALNAINITSDSVYISWAPTPGITHHVFYSSLPYSNPAPSSQANGISSTNNCLINELYPNTKYYYWVRSVCGSNVGPWVSGGTFNTISEIYQSCNGAFYGVNPQTTFTPVCSGNFELITDTSAAGQFTNITLSSDKKYIFKSDIGTDYLTITNATGTAVLAKGSSPLTWYSGANSGAARYYLHSQVACGISSSARSKYISCIDACETPTALTSLLQGSTSANLSWNGNSSTFQPYYSTDSTPPTDNYPTTSNVSSNKFINLTNLTAGATYYFWVRSVCGTTTSPWASGGSFTTIAGGCNFGNLFPANSFTPTCTGSAETITTSAYAGEYSLINISAGKQYTFASSKPTDFITITNLAGTVAYAFGNTPLDWSSGTTTEQIRYYIHTNSNCGTQASNRTRTIKCCTSLLTPNFNQMAPICYGGLLNPLPTISNNGISGVWTPALNYFTTTTYSFTPSAGQCATPTAMTIEVIPSIDNTVTLNGTTLSAAFSSGTYQWYKCENTPILIQDAISQNYTPTQNGFYSVKISNMGCFVTSPCVEVNSLDNQDFSNSNNLKIYPNPSQGQFVVETGNITPKQIEILDNIGRIIKILKTSSNNNIIDIKGLSDGIYYLKIISQNEQMIKKIVLKK